MEKRTSAFARIIAVIALVGAVAVVIAVLTSSLGESGSSRDSGERGNRVAQKERPRTKAKVYVVKSGDTLFSIAHQTGVPVREIRELNPEVDPQILRTGEALKLR